MSRGDWKGEHHTAHAGCATGRQPSRRRGPWGRIWKRLLLVAPPFSLSLLAATKGAAVPFRPFHQAPSARCWVFCPRAEKVPKTRAAVTVGNPRAWAWNSTTSSPVHHIRPITEMTTAGPLGDKHLFYLCQHHHPRLLSATWKSYGLWTRSSSARFGTTILQPEVGLTSHGEGSSNRRRNQLLRPGKGTLSCRTQHRLWAPTNFWGLSPTSTTHWMWHPNGRQRDLSSALRLASCLKYSGITLSSFMWYSKRKTPGDKLITVLLQAGHITFSLIAT